MSTIKTGAELAKAALNVAKNFKTIYILGCFGAPMTDSNKIRYTNNYAYNKRPSQFAKIMAATNDTFGFDCVCLIKGLLWGWTGDKSRVYGGAAYASYGVPDIGADAMINRCSNISTNFSKIEVGEAVWSAGHIGIYVGNGLAVECTSKWEGKVLISACNTNVPGYHRRDWTKHGKLPYVSYPDTSTPPAPPVKPKDPEVVTPGKKTMDQLVREVIQGLWGNGTARAKALTAAGYNYAKVQAAVNAFLASSAKPPAGTPWVPKVGDVVNFTGNKHYSSANAISGPSCKGGKATITQIYKLGSSRHPYHLIKVPGGGSTVYGWVDESTFTKA